MNILRCGKDHADLWITFRAALWPEATTHENDVARILASDKMIAILVVDGSNALGFAEASLRYDYVNGCETSPVVFLEGIYVSPPHRCKGAARVLVDAVAAWGRKHGCSEFASDALLDNIDSHQMHRALGFTDVERIVVFHKKL
jgi:aminoglycoside 6'-N-acetyltransferase I